MLPGSSPTYEAQPDRRKMDERVIARQWQHLARQLLRFARSPLAGTGPWRSQFEALLRSHAAECLTIHWRSPATGTSSTGEELIPIEGPDARYGWLAVAPECAHSVSLAGIARDVAALCAVIGSLCKHRALVRLQLTHLTSLPPARLKLTAREADVLWGLLQGETEDQTARHLGVARTTVHTHRQRLYRRLDVHSAHETVLRCFQRHLLDGLEAMPGKPDGRDLWADVAPEP